VVAAIDYSFAIDFTRNPTRRVNNCVERLLSLTVLRTKHCLQPETEAGENAFKSKTSGLRSRFKTDLM